MPSIRALTNEAAAVAGARRGDADEALRRLHLARQLWTSINSRLNAAKLRLQIADLQLEQGDRNGAATEMRAALAAADELDSEKLRRQCQALLRRSSLMTAPTALNISPMRCAGVRNRADEKLNLSGPSLRMETSSES